MTTLPPGTFGGTSDASSFSPLFQIVLRVAISVALGTGAALAAVAFGVASFFAVLIGAGVSGVVLAMLSEPPAAAPVVDSDDVRPSGPVASA